MRITQVKTTLVHADWRNWTFVQVFTDEGLVGTGEATLRSREHAVAGAIEDMSRVLIGSDPRRVQALWQTLYADFHVRGGAVLMTALSGIDLALWDILGQSLGVPIYQVFGGAIRRSAWAYANGWFGSAREPDAQARLAAEAVERGFTALKWNPFHGADGWLAPSATRAAVARLQAVRQAVGDDVELMLEAHGLLTPSQALRLAHIMEPFRPFWLEEPVPPEDVRAMAHVRQRSPIPIATGERLYHKAAFADLIEARAADIIQPDVQHVGGLFEARAVASLAEARYLSFAPHNSGSPLGTAASLQLAACTPNFLIQELPVDDVPWRDEIVEPPVEVPVGGQLPIPDRPGLGVRLNEAVAAKYPYQNPDPSPTSRSITPEIERLARTLTDPRPRHPGASDPE